MRRPGAEHGVGFGTALKCDHSTSLLDCRLGVVLCVCDVRRDSNSVQYDSSWNFICEHLLVKCVVSCGKMIPLS